MDGKLMFINLPNFPTARIGASGGIELPDLKSYPSAFQAAIQGDKLLVRQVARAAKKTATTVATPAPATGKSPTAAKETPASRKQKVDQGLEVQLA